MATEPDKAPEGAPGQRSPVHPLALPSSLSAAAVPPPPGCRSANALLEVPQASGSLAAGSLASALLIDDLQLMPVPQEVPFTQL